MAIFEKTIRNKNFDKLLRKLEQEIPDSSWSADLEAGSDFKEGDARCSVRVFERYSMIGGNRLSLTLTLFQNGDSPIRLPAITAGGSQAVFFKVNTLGEESFLNDVKDLLEEFWRSKMFFGWFDAIFSFIFPILFLLFPILFLLFIGMFFFALISNLRTWNKNNHSPRLTVPATVVAKRTDVSHSSSANAGDMSGAHGYDTSTFTSYYVTFQVESGDRMEFEVDGSDYGLLVQGDIGKLSFQGTRYLGFERS